MEPDDVQILEQDGVDVDDVAGGSAHPTDAKLCEDAAGGSTLPVNEQGFDAAADLPPDCHVVVDDDDADFAADPDADFDADEALTAAAAALAAGGTSGGSAVRRRAGRKATVAAIAISMSLHGVILSAGVFATIAVSRAARQVRASAGDEAVVTDVMSPRSEDPIPEETSLPAAAESAAAPLETPPAEATQRPVLSESSDVPEPAATPEPQPSLAAFELPADAPAPTLGISSKSADALPKVPRRSAPVANVPVDPASSSAAASPSTPPSTNAPAPAAAVTTPARVAKAAGGRTGRRSGFDDRGLPIPDYPAESRRRREQGLVELDVEILPDGRVGEVKVITDPGHARLVDAAIAAVKRGEFEAATSGGKSVSGHLIVPFRFVLH